MEEKREVQYQVYSRRWAVLLVYVGVGAAMQYLWATFFSVTTEAWHFYGFTERVAGEAAMSALSMIIMAGMVILSIPASAVFARLGWYKTVAAASVLMSICAIIRGYVGGNYTALVICTIGESICQPFILNAFGMLAAHWFPPKERGIANGCGMLSIYIGVMMGQFGFPWLQNTFGLDIPGVLKVYGYATVAFTALFIAIARDKPAVPPCEEELISRVNYVEGMKQLAKNRKFLAGMLIYFTLNGVYGAFTTLIEPIINFFNNNTIESLFIGMLGTIITIAGCVGTLLLPGITDRDRQHRRLPLVRICLTGGIIGMVLFIMGHSTGLLLLAAIIFGFFFTGVMPVSLVFGCEAGYPVSEGTTDSLLQLIGNLGRLLILAVVNGVFRGNHSMSMGFIIGITVVCIVIGCVTKEASEKERMLVK